MIHVNLTKQINLFTPAIAYKEKALDAMQRFALKEAQNHLKTAQQIDPYLADLDTLSRAVEFLLDLSVQPKTKTSGLTRAWRKVCEARKSVPRAVHSVLESLICNRVLQLLPPDYCDYVDSKTRTLHIAYCYLVLNRPDEAHKKLLDYLTSHPDETHACLWGYFGDASYQLKRHEESKSGYLRAFFMDPQSVDLERLQNPQLQQIYKNLCRQHPEETARALLPIHSWLEGVLQIPRGNTWLARFVQQRRFDLSAELLLYPTRRYHQFALCLYIDQSGLQGDVDFETRDEMKRLDQELFQQYLEVLERNVSRNQGKKNKSWIP